MCGSWMDRTDRLVVMRWGIGLQCAGVSLALCTLAVLEAGRASGEVAAGPMPVGLLAVMVACGSLEVLGAMISSVAVKKDWVPTVWADKKSKHLTVRSRAPAPPPPTPRPALPAPPTPLAAPPPPTPHPAPRRAPPRARAPAASDVVAGSQCGHGQHRPLLRDDRAALRRRRAAGARPTPLPPAPRACALADATAGAAF